MISSIRYDLSVPTMPMRKAVTSRHFWSFFRQFPVWRKVWRSHDHLTLLPTMPFARSLKNFFKRSHKSERKIPAFLWKIPISLDHLHNLSVGVEYLYSIQFHSWFVEQFIWFVLQFLQTHISKLHLNSCQDWISYI